MPNSDILKEDDTESAQHTDTSDLPPRPISPVTIKVTELKETNSVNTDHRPVSRFLSAQLSPRDRADSLISRSPIIMRKARIGGSLPNVQSRDGLSAGDSARQELSLTEFLNE